MRISKRFIGVIAGAALAMSQAPPCVAGPVEESSAQGSNLDAPLDVVQVEGGRLYYVNGTGLLIYDVSDVFRPRLVGRHAMAGWPLGLAVRDAVATIVMRETDILSEDGTAVGPAMARAVDTTDAARIRVIGESPIEGDPVEARATDDALYVVSRSQAPAAPQVIVTALGLDRRDTLRASSIVRDGSTATLRAIGRRVILARADAFGPGTHVDVLVDSQLAGLVLRGSLEVTSTVALADPNASPQLDAPDVGHVHLRGCRTVPCKADDLLEVASLDVTLPDAPRITSYRTLRSPDGPLATRFDGGRLYVARRGSLALGAPLTPISAIDLGNSETADSALLIQGVVWNLIPAGQRLFAMGTRGDRDATRERLFLDAIDFRDPRRPTLAGELLMGDDWTSSIVESYPQAMTSCGGRFAVPFETWSFGRPLPRNRVAVFVASEGGFTEARDVAIDAWIDRLVCVGGVLFAVTDSGLRLVDRGPLDR